MKNNTILCPIDFSESSEEAMKWALHLARVTEGQVIFLFCYRLISNGKDDETTDLKKNIENDAVRKFDQLEGKIILDHSVTRRFISEVGFFPLRIESYLRKGSVNLLVLGNSIMENFDEHKNLSFEVFLKNAKVPVVVIPLSKAIHIVLPKSIVNQGSPQ